jgi:hypothetical protein
MDIDCRLTRPLQVAKNDYLAVARNVLPSLGTTDLADGQRFPVKSPKTEPDVPGGAKKGDRWRVRLG